MATSSYPTVHNKYESTNNENAGTSIHVDESEQEKEIHSAVKYRKIATDNLLFQAKRVSEILNFK